MITVYSTPNCTYCNKAMTYLRDNGVEFNKIDVVANPDKRVEMINLSGQMGVPVIRAGERFIVGFNEQKLKEFLGI